MAKTKLPRVAEIITGPDARLNTVCETVFRQEDIREELKLLYRTVLHTKNAVGLAAPQIGVLMRAICVFPYRKGYPEMMINPVITRWSEETETKREGCLSYPQVGETPVERYSRITVEWEEWNSDKANTKDFGGWEARVIQHEIDHLNGICKVGEVL